MLGESLCADGATADEQAHTLQESMLGELSHVDSVMAADSQYLQQAQ
jgi:hypothetical protein